MKNLIILYSVIFCISCGKICNKDLLVGEMLQIPIDFSNFENGEISSIYIMKVNNGDSTNTAITNYLYGHQVQETNYLTDNQIDGDYSSDLDGSNLYFYFRLSDTTYQMLDSLTDITIKKSKGDVDDKCYEDHPNIQIDIVNFTHSGKTLGKDDIVVLSK